MSKLHKKRKPSKKLLHSKPVAYVIREYAQFNVPDYYIQSLAEALSAEILSKHYEHSLRLERVTEDSEN